MSVSSFDFNIKDSIGAITFKSLHSIYEASKQGGLLNEIRQEFNQLPSCIQKKIHSQISYLNEWSSEHNFHEIDFLDSSIHLQKAIEEVVKEQFPELDFSEKTSIYQRFLNIYEDIENESLSERTRFEISLLPNEISKQLFECFFVQLYNPLSFCEKRSEFKFKKIDILKYPSSLEIALDTMAQKIFLEFDGSQQEYLKRKTNSMYAKYPLSPIDLFRILDQIKELVGYDGSVDDLIGALEKNPQLCEAVPFFISRLGIRSEAVRIKIAKICASHNKRGVAEVIEKFRIKNETALIEVAEICAKQNGGITASNILKFGITDKKVLVSIAMLCVQQNADQAIQYIDKFDIPDERDRITIAKMSARQNGIKTALFMDSFKIKNEIALIEIAKLCAIQDGTGTASMIYNFDISSLPQLQLILSLCIFDSIDDFSNTTELIGSELMNPDLKEQMIRLFDPLNHMNTDNPSLNDLKEFLLKHVHDLIQEHIKSDLPLFEEIRSCLGKVKDIHSLEIASRWAARMLFFLSALSLEEREHVIKAKLFTHLFSIQSPVLRQNLSKLLIEFALKPGNFAIYLKDSKEGQSKGKRILDLVLGALQIQGVTKKTTDHIKSVFGSVFKGGIEIRPFLEMLHLLINSPCFAPNEKEHVLHMLLEGAIQGPGEKGQEYKKRVAKLKPELEQRVIALLVILLFKNESMMLSTPSIQNALNGTLLEKLHFDAQDDHFRTFQKLFMGARNPNALITYAAKLFSLNQPAVIDDLGRYVNSVMHGTFHHERYNLEMNPHLQKVEEHNPGLIAKLAAPLNRVFTVFVAEKEEEEFNPNVWLQEKVEHGHMKPVLLPNLDALLKGKAVDHAQLLPIENALHSLLGSKDKESQILNLREIRKELVKLDSCPFKEDVEEQLDLLSKEASTLLEEVEVVDTDDYLDLLLCGTEVAGSCQNVNGSAGSNKGLLGYILDGKNRLIAVKNKEGKILARAKVSVLLDDEHNPVLYLEKLYTQGKFINQSLNAIFNMAFAKAQSLDIPLAAHNQSDYCTLAEVHTQAFGKELLSHGGGVSYEYSDAVFHLADDGMYNIPSFAIELLMPK